MLWEKVEKELDRLQKEIFDPVIFSEGTVSVVSIVKEDGE